MKNKPLFHCFIVSLFYWSLPVAYAQEDAGTTVETGLQYKPSQNDIGVTFGIRSTDAPVLASPGVTGTVVFKYLITDNLAARAAIALSTNGGGLSGTTKSDTTGTGILTTTITKSSAWAINLGLQRSFAGTEKLDPYIGADVFFGSGKGSLDSTSEVVNENGVGKPLLSESPSTEIGDYDRIKVTMSGNAIFALGFNAFVGFNYFFAPKFALGAEFAWGFSDFSMKNGTTTSISKRGKVVDTTVTPNSATTKTGGFGAAGSGMVTVSWFF